MTGNEIRKKFLGFFEGRGHKVAPSSSLIPDDPSVLLTTAGMQQFKRYYTGELDAKSNFGGLNTATVQKCFRTSDIDEVGDESHLTFFEMLGNFSFGGYWKEEAIRYAYEFIRREMGLKIDYVTVFGGDEEALADEEAAKVWERVKKESREIFEVRRAGREDNFWGPTGVEGPCGPTTEIYGRGVEVWNIVFNEFYRTREGKYLPIEEKGGKRGIDTGMGLERLAMMAQGVGNIFETDLLAPIAEMLPEEMTAREKRIAADHLRGAAFLIADGVRPSNKEAGYVLRRILRRVMAREGDYAEALSAVAAGYGEFYPKLNLEEIRRVYGEEENRFNKTLRRGLGELKRLVRVDAREAFDLYQSYGLPYEVIADAAGTRADFSREEFERELERHQERSRAGAEKKFGGHGLVLNTGELKAGDEEEMEKVTRLHTATHLLHQALRQALGEEVKQAGSDITPERTRFDFSFSRRLEEEELRQVERIVNEVVERDLPVKSVVMPKEEAEKTGALHFFKQKYPDEVTVYYVGESLARAFSKEFCGGPHVKRTGEIGKFRITKQEAVGAGLRRIRAVVEQSF